GIRDGHVTGVQTCALPIFDGQFTVFGHVSDGMEVLQKISVTPVDASGLATERVEIRRVTIRETPPEPFVNDSVQQLGGYRAVLRSEERRVGKSVGAGCWRH